ncbi:hypothetical protein PABG_03318 [Paracoccidioides brasiliensis Pb03]|nr:hypothetical protein PABG_03318 [Paracoccidioides brasiliensis Pb03]
MSRSRHPHCDAASSAKNGETFKEPEPVVIVKPTTNHAFPSFVGRRLAGFSNFLPPARISVQIKLLIITLYERVYSYQR